jgi:Ran GTPase-activating protein (RanGAP) involved in mRNA processing and transport
VLKAENKALPILGSKIKEFELSQCEIDSELIKQLKSFLISCQNIKILTISHIGSKFDWSENVIAVCQSLQFSFPFLKHLRQLNLSCIRFGDRLVPELANALNSAPLLTDLDLTSIGLTGFGLRNLAEAYLASGPTKQLHSLNLTSNKFSDLEQVFHFGQAMS